MTRFTGIRRLCLGVALLLAIVAVLPPLYGLARRYELAEALQFSLYAMAVPALFAVVAPWAEGRLAWLARWVDHLAARRRRQVEPAMSVLILGLYSGAMVAWRTPAAVDAIETWPWLVALEAVSLVAIGITFWLKLVESGPLMARSRQLRRALMAAMAMWTLWTVSYLAGFSSTSWYAGFGHVAGRSLSVAADQQFSTGVLWLVAAVAFMTVIFWNLLTWLRSEDELEMDQHRSVVGQRPSA